MHSLATCGWCWQPEVVSIFRDLDPARWRELDHNPILLLDEFTHEQLELRGREAVLHSRVNYAYRRWQEYMSSKHTWGDTHTGLLGHNPVAYFSAEFGIHESLPNYSGGLGVLAGGSSQECIGSGNSSGCGRPCSIKRGISLNRSMRPVGNVRSIPTSRTRDWPSNKRRLPMERTFWSRWKPARDPSSPRFGKSMWAVSSSFYSIAMSNKTPLKIEN